MDERIARDRQNAVRRRMTHHKLNCMIVTGQENVTYLTGFLGHDSWVVIMGRGAVLVTDSRYTEQAEGECFGCRIVERKGSIIKAVAKVIGRSKSVKVVGIEKSVSLHLSAELKKHIKHRFKPVGNLVENVRRTKDMSEIKLIGAAARLSWRALSATLKRFHAGMTESEAAGLLEFEMRKLGAGPAFETIMAFGANGSRNHHQPGMRRLKKNDTILIDFGAKLGGYCSDMTRCFVFGKCSRQYEKVYYGVLAAQQAAIGKIRAGAQLKDIDCAARAELESRGLSVYAHGTGHGVGLQIHENPFMSKIAKGTLQAGDVVTIEPGVYIPGKFGVRIEDDVLVTEKGFRIVSKDRHFGFSNGKMPILKSR